jgi:hypothetical protein
MAGLQLPRLCGPYNVWRYVVPLSRQPTNSLNFLSRDAITELLQAFNASFETRSQVSLGSYVLPWSHFVVLICLKSGRDYSVAWQFELPPEQ